MTVPLLLVGSGGLGRETAETARATGVFRPVGYLDDDEALRGTLVGGLPVLGGIHLIQEHPSALVVLCIGKGVGRMRLAERLRSMGLEDERYAKVIHPSVDVPQSCSVGAGSILLAGTVLTADVSVGRHVVCMPQVTLTHDNTVDDAATLCASATLGGWVHIGSRAYLGMACSVRERVRIGPDATVGMGAVVLNDVPAGQTWVGVPASAMAGPTVRGTTVSGRRLSAHSPTKEEV